MISPAFPNLLNQFNIIVIKQSVMVKKQISKCSKRCKNHLLSIKPLIKSAYHEKQIRYYFCPTEPPYPTYPYLNQDKKYYTPSFILQENKKKYEDQDSKYRDNHKRLVFEHVYLKSQLYEPKPKSKSMYCHVCKDYYKDYLKHVRHPSHRMQSRKNRWSTYINELIQKFSLIRKKSKPYLTSRDNYQLQDYQNIYPQQRSQVKEESKLVSTYINISQKISMEFEKNKNKKNSVPQEIIVISDSLS